MGIWQDGLRKLRKNWIAGVSAEVQKERFPNSIRTVVKLLTGRRFVVTSKALNPLQPNDTYRRRTAPLTSKLCILYIY